jgi:Flp pilus assembly protein TadD
MSDFLKAEVASNEGDRKKALVFYQAAAQADPRNASLRLKLASIDVRDGQLSQALNEVNEALALDPNMVDARLLAAG